MQFIVMILLIQQFSYCHPMHNRTNRLRRRHAIINQPNQSEQPGAYIIAGSTNYSRRTETNLPPLAQAEIIPQMDSFLKLIGSRLQKLEAEILNEDSELNIEAIQN